MNTKAINSAAGVINAALTQNRTAAGIALALDSAGLLMTPETAAELATLRERFAVSDHSVDEDPIAYSLTEKAEAVEDDVRPQVRTLRALLAGQRAQVGPQVDVSKTEAGTTVTFTPRGDAS
ncbi:MAG: hypothetical protein HOQ47_09480 [Streptomyces sp.]|nr:hypothetical protein [Streptomyces sp.]